MPLKVLQTMLVKEMDLYTNHNKTWLQFSVGDNVPEKNIFGKKIQHQLKQASLTGFNNISVENIISVSIWVC